MSRNVFGWDLPPGCTHKMIDEAFGGPDPSELQQNVLGLLEKARLPQTVCDAIMEMIADAEQDMREPDPDDQRDQRLEDRYLERNRDYDAD
jgi:hypothetical protein